MDTQKFGKSGIKGSSQRPCLSSTEKTHWKLAAVEGLNQALFQERGIYQFASMTLDYAFHIVGGQAGSLLLASPKNKHLEFFLSKGSNPVPRNTTVAWHSGIAGYVFHSGISEFVSDAPRDPRYWPEIDRLTGYFTQNLIATPIKHPNGHSMGVVEILNVNEEALSEEDKKFLQVLSSFLSMALHRQWSDQMTQREDLKNFIKDCAHDMKNLLMPILDGTDLLKDESRQILDRVPSQEILLMKPSIHVWEESLGMIERNGRRLQRKAKDLVDCLMGHIALNELTSCSIQSVTDEVLDALSIPIHKLNLTIEKYGLETLPFLQGDERKLFSVFYNLLHNAVTALHKGGVIRIYGSREGEHICVKICDDGPGISQEEIDVLFSTKIVSKKSLGNGLGMNSVRHAIEEHGGFIKVESAKGIGTTVYISLPIQGMLVNSNWESPDSPRDGD